MPLAERRCAPPGAHARPAVLAALLSAALLLLTGAGAAQAHVVFAHGRAYGVMRPIRARARAPTVLGDRVAPLTVGGAQPPLSYGGGPLMLSSKLYLIFWEQEAGEFSTGYTEPIVQYAKDLQAEDARTTDELSVAEQYTDKAGNPITGKVEFGGDVLVTARYPPLEKAEGCTKAPCVTDKQIRKEIMEQIEANHWPTDSAGSPEAQYLLYTPRGVANCEFGECSPEAFCAYHSEITGIGTESRVAVYSDLPYVPECDSGQAPSGVGGNRDTDGTLDSEIHEIVESATDPAPPGGYTDSRGEEVADKCTAPTVEAQPEVYGTPLGGSLGEGTAFNQLIDGHGYYTQQIWSNAPTRTPKPTSEGEPAGCVARIGPTPSFTAPTGGQTGHAIDFDGSGSYDVDAAIAKYEWSFGDGSTPDTLSGATPVHYYVQPGTYQVSLTVSDSGASADASTQTLPITIAGPAIAAPTATILSPADNQTYTQGEAVATSFQCADAAGGPGIASCTDSRSGDSPGTLDTTAAGKHSYTVTAVSLDGQRDTAALQYTVLSPTGGNPGGGGGAPGGSPSSSSTGATDAPSTSTSSSSASAGASAGARASLEPPAPKSTTAAQKLARALRACKKLRKNKRARCVALAKRRFAPPARKRGKASPRALMPTLGLTRASHFGEL